MCSLGVSQVFCPTGPCPGPQAWKDRIKPLQRFTPFIPPPLKNLKRQKAECPIPSLSVQGVLDLDHTKQGSEHKTQVLFSSFCPPRQTNKETKKHTKKDQTSECQDYRYRHVVKEAAPSRHWWHWLRVSALSSTCSVTGRAGEVTGTLSFSQTRVHAALTLRKTELFRQQMMWLWPFCHLHLIVWNTVIGTCWSLMRINKPEFDFNCRADRSSMTCKTHQEQSKVKCWKAVCELESWEILDFNDFRFEDVSFPQIIQKLKSTDLQNKPAFTILRGKHHRLPYSAETLQFKISQNTCSSL